MEDAGDSALKRGAQPTLSLQQAEETLDSLIDETNVPADDLLTRRRRPISVGPAMNALFAETPGYEGILDLDGLDASDGILGEDGLPIRHDGPSTAPQLAGAETNPARIVRRLDDNIDFWIDIEDEPTGSDE